MCTYTKRNLRDVENQAPKFDMPDEMEARYSGQEAVYVMVRGSARVKVDDDVVELGEWYAIRFGNDTMRNMEAGARRRRVPGFRSRRRST